MAAGATYTPIATTTISGTGTNSVTFSSISGSYTDLIIVTNQGATASENTGMQFNSDTGSNYSNTFIYGNGSSAASSRASSATYIRIDPQSSPTTSVNAVDIVHIMNYSNSTTYKTILSRGNSAGVAVAANVGLWRSTAAITSVKLYALSGNYADGSTFTLYGVLNA